MLGYIAISFVSGAIMPAILTSGKSISFMWIPLGFIWPIALPATVMIYSFIHYAKLQLKLVHKFNPDIEKWF